MTGYRRFVAYVYEYQKGKKGRNCGFIRVEAREKRCRTEVRLNCPGLLPGALCEIFGFVRREGLMDGSLLGTCVTGENRAECVIETDRDRMGEGAISLEQMGGMILTTVDGAFFATEWDDRPVRPEHFRRIKKREESAEEAPPVQKKESSDAERISEPAKEDAGEPGEETDPEEKISPGTGAEMEAEETGGRAPEGDYDPFEDGEFTECRKITPEDFRCLHPADRSLKGNRFLQYGFQAFGHLLLGKTGAGRFFLGVPGVYDQQEKFMAGMFGFPYFKYSRHIRPGKGKGGYWYRLINAPDLHKIDGFFQDAPEAQELLR